MKTNHANGERGAAAPIAASGQRASRRQHGKSLRKACPRSSHADVVLGQGQRDPLALIEQSNQGRVQKLLPIRFTRMAESAFAFFRGTAILQAHDLKGTPSAGITVQCCGDCHLVNFGGFATPERELVFDINDFDETHPGPFEWDVKRLATSVVLAARWLGLSNGDARRALTALLEAYRKKQADFADESVLDTWYAKIAFEELIQQAASDPKYVKRLKKSLDKATENTSEHVFHNITTTVHGQPRIDNQPPLLYHGDLSEFDLDHDVRHFLESYRGTLPRERQALFDRFQLVDTAYKVVGVGSVGTRCAICLFGGNQDDHLFLQIKEARPSVLEGLAGPSGFANNGERVVSGQHLMQSASDIFLGWSRGAGGRDFYIRQMHDMKLAPNLAGYTPSMLATYAKLCGRALARAHAKSGEATTIAGYLGQGAVFDEAIARYALAYADQVEDDYDHFQAAIRSGRFPIETLPSEIEQAIR
jgi:uncharacterized protein (DUF2252 family)